MGLWAFSGNRETVVDPGVRPSIVNHGVGVSRAGRVAALRDGGGADDWLVVLYDLTGRQVDALRVNRAFALPISAPVLDDNGTRLAFALDEPASATDSRRIARTLVVAVETGAILAMLDGFDEPVFGGIAGTLWVRDTVAGGLAVYDANLTRQGTLALPVQETVGAYDVSPDGRHIAYSSNLVMRMRDTVTGADWVAVDDDGSELFSPAFSPDGTRLAMLGTLVTSRVPYVVALQAGRTVALSRDAALPDSIVECAGRIGWAR